MADFEPPERLVILKTEHWVLNHRVDSALPGYLMLGARMFTNDLSLMPPEALGELGPCLARAQGALKASPSICISGATATPRDTPSIFTSFLSAGGSSGASLAIRATVSFGISIDPPMPVIAATRRMAEN
jgi:hypothetical protein